MEVRNVQRTGKMHYAYLPTSWCKRYNITSDSKVAITENGDGSLTIAPEIREKVKKKIDLTLPTKYKDTLINLIMACYVNPTHSFNIRMDKKINMTPILDQKNIVSALEFVELDGEHITYESSMTIDEPDSLLKTMVKKIKNLLYVMIENYNPDLIAKYEEEIDRSKILIQKAVISALVQNEPTTLKSIDMHYTAQIATELERAVDYLIQLDKTEKTFLKEMLTIVEHLKTLLEERLDYMKGVAFTKRILNIKELKSASINDFNKMRIKRLLQSVAEIMLDWSVSKELE